MQIFIFELNFIQPKVYKQSKHIYLIETFIFAVILNNEQHIKKKSFL